MIVISGGLVKSASGWLFNLTNDLLVAAGRSDVRQVREEFDLGGILRHENCNLGQPTLGKLLALTRPHRAGRTFVVKTHGAPGPAMRVLMAAGVVRATYTYRDPRDVVVSALEHGEKSRQRGENQGFHELHSVEDAIPYVAKQLTIASRWLTTPGVLAIRYEDLTADPEAALADVARHLDLATLRDVIERNDPTQGTGGRLHFNKGIAGRYREVLDDDQVARCNRTFAPFLRQAEYAAN